MVKVKRIIFSIPLILSVLFYQPVSTSALPIENWQNADWESVCLYYATQNKTFLRADLSDPGYLWYIIKVQTDGRGAYTLRGYDQNGGLVWERNFDKQAHYQVINLEDEGLAPVPQIKISGPNDIYVTGGHKKKGSHYVTVALYTKTGVSTCQPSSSERTKSSSTGFYESGSGGGGDTGGGDTGGGDTGNQPPRETINPCNGCEFLKEMLACPEWDTYMGQWEDMLNRVIPPPPDWNEVAQTIAGGMSQGLADAVKQGVNDAIGNTPPPTTGDLENTLPSQPDLPNQHPELEQLQPLDPFPDGTPEFNLEDREEIQIVDESQPYTITDPILNFETTPIDTPVFPNDPNNHNGGISNPSPVVEWNNNPSPTIEAPNNGPVIPNNPTPIPATGDTSYPSPSGTVPFEEKKYYKEQP